MKPPGPPPLKVAPLAINVALPALAVSRKSVKEPLLPGPSEPLLVKLALAAVELLWKIVPPPPPRTVATPVLLVKLALPALEVSKKLCIAAEGASDLRTIIDEAGACQSLMC